MIITHTGIPLQPEVRIQQQIWKGLRQGTWGGHGAWASPEVVADGATVLAVGATGGEDQGYGRGRFDEPGAGDRGVDGVGGGGVRGRGGAGGGGDGAGGGEGGEGEDAGVADAEGAGGGGAGDPGCGVAAVPAGVAVVHAGGDGGRSAVAGVDAACAAGAGGAGAGVRAPVGARWLWPVDVVVGE